jgi:hypothetical protein
MPTKKQTILCCPAPPPSTTRRRKVCRIGLGKAIMSIENPRIVALFDVDGTLTIPRGEITEEMMTFMKELSKKVTVGIVGGTAGLPRWS